MEGPGSYGRGLTAALARAGEWVIEFDRPREKATKDGAKSDPLDAVRAAREEIRQQLRGLSTKALTTHCAKFRDAPQRPVAERCVRNTMRAVARRINRSGDRQLNYALYIVALTRQCHYTERRRAEGRTNREIRRCLKRYIARRVWRLLEHPTTLQIAT